VPGQLPANTFVFPSDAMRKISITLIIFAIAFITGSVSEKEGRLGSANRLIAATRHPPHPRII
jgi:hypothetical protein